MRGGPGDAERRQRWSRLFEELDRNKDGRVDVHELRQGLARLGGGDPDRGAQQVPSPLGTPFLVHPLWIPWKEPWQPPGTTCGWTRGPLDPAFPSPAHPGLA